MSNNAPSQIFLPRIKPLAAASSLALCSVVTLFVNSVRPESGCRQDLTHSLPYLSETDSCEVTHFIVSDNSDSLQLGM